MEQYPNYSQPPQQQQYVSQQPMAPVMTMGNWIITMLIMCIPIVNLVMLIVWAASSTENPNRSNWAKAQLIFMVVGIVLYIILAGAIIGAVGGMAGAFE